MAVPLERWYRGFPKTPEDLEQSLANLERILARKDQLLENAPIPVVPIDPQAGDVVRYDGSQWVPWSPKYMTARLSADQSTNIDSGDHVEFNQAIADSGHITLSTGSGQENGIFTLPEGVYRLQAFVRATFSDSTATLVFRWAVPGGSVIGPQGIVLPVTTAGHVTFVPSVATQVSVGPGSGDVELRITGVTDLAVIRGLYTFATIEALA